MKTINNFYPKQNSLIVLSGLMLIFGSLLSCERGAMNFQGGAEKRLALRVPFESEITMPSRSTMVDPSPGKKLIKMGSLSFETNDLAKTRKDVEAILGKHQAYIAQENQESYPERVVYHQEIRVQADKFDPLVQQIEVLGVKLLAKTISTQDVTEEFIDTEARLKTKKELEGRYVELLKRAKTVEEVLSIETQIGNVRSEIESKEGRLKYLSNQVALSTLSLTYYETIGTNFGFAAKFLNAFRNGWENLLAFLIGVFAVWPFLIIFSAAIWFFIRWRKKPTMQAGPD